MKTELWLCLGYVHLANDKKGIQFQELNDQGDRIPKKLVYGMKIGNCWAGMTYTLTFTDEGLLYGKPDLGNPWKCKVELAAIQLQSRAVNSEFDIMRRNMKDATSPESIFDCLKPLREAYHTTNAAGRTALIAQVITFMQRKL